MLCAGQTPGNARGWNGVLWSGLHTEDADATIAEQVRFFTGLVDEFRQLRTAGATSSVSRLDEPDRVLIVGLLPFTVILPLLIALAGQRVQGRARTIYQAFIFAPLLVAPGAAATVWRWLLHPGTGFVDRILGSNRNWVYDVDTAHGVIILITGWQLLGFAVRHQLHTQRLLQLLQLRAETGLSQMQPLRRPPEMQLFPHGHHPHHGRSVNTLRRRIRRNTAFSLLAAGILRLWTHTRRPSVSRRSFSLRIRGPVRPSRRTSRSHARRPNSASACNWS
jgi:hypothetical protein